LPKVAGPDAALCVHAGIVQLYCGVSRDFQHAFPSHGSTDVAASFRYAATALKLRRCQTLADFVCR